MRRIYSIAIAALLVVFTATAVGALAKGSSSTVGDLQALATELAKHTDAVSTSAAPEITIEVLTPSATAPATTAKANPAPTAAATAKAKTADKATAAAKPKATATAKPAATALQASATIKPAAADVQASAMAAQAAASTDIYTQIQKFKVTASKYYSSYGFSSNHYKYTEAEVRMLAIVIHMEARGEPYRAKLAIANVVMNRVLAPGYPGATIKEVVTRPNQFCYKASVNPTAECIKAAREVLKYETWVVPQNTYFFRATGSKSNWGRHEYWGKIGATTFYQDRYSGRYNGDAVPAGLFERVYQWPQYGCKPAARVRKIQIMLNGLGYHATADGYFGTDTKTALMNFQRSRGLTADGIAGPATLNALIRKYGLDKYLKL